MRPVREHIDQPPEASWQFHVRRETAFPFKWHYHPEIELVLITRGSGTRIIGDSIEHYRPGDLTLIGGDLPHTYLSAPDIDDHEAIVVQFRRDFLGDDLLTRPEFTPIAGLLDTASAGVQFESEPGRADQLRTLISQPPLGRTLSLLAFLAGLAAERGTRTLVTLPATRPILDAERQRIDAACTYLQSNYRERIRLEDVAAATHMSPTGFSRFFRRALGRTVTDYVTELRVAAACQLLADTDLAIADVAARSGYENLSNFNRRFRALKGVTPRTYRRAMNGQPIAEGLAASDAVPALLGHAADRTSHA